MAIVRENKSEEIASPCGLIAKSLFNDTYKLSFEGTLVPINETGISWPNDRGKKYKQ